MTDSDEDVKDPKFAGDEPKMKPDDEMGTEPFANGDGAPSLLQDLPHISKSRSTSQSPVKNVKKESGTSTPLDAYSLEATIGGEVTLKMEPGKGPKLTRTTSQKIPARPPPLFLDEPNRTEEACQSFSVIYDCEYANKSLGLTEDEGLDDVQCECDEEWDSTTKTNRACGEDSDCINRATKIECIADCRCGRDCQNKRFQRKQYCSVTVFKTEKKGYGLRADSDLRANDFIFEYLGEVIGENAFSRRMHQYDEQGIKHFYFMSLNKGEFIDATKRGNLGRFCNHSCNPNCYVDKWVVGDKLRMGIFAERNIKTGEELTFNYNVDRYGAEPQPCYCGEPNCTGFIGGRTQTERATKLSNATIEALGLEDGDDWDIAAAKKAKRSRKTGEADEEYVSDVKPKTLEEDAVAKVMAQLMQKKEKWIVVKLLERIQTARDEKVFTRVAKMHGYRILKSVLSTFMEDANVCLQVLDVLFKFPRLTRNKIQDSKIEEVVERLKTHDHERVAKQATEILDVWSKLELGYRIPKKNPNDPSNITPIPRDDWRGRKRERTKSPSPPQGPAAPSGPRSNVPQRNANFYRPPRPFPPRNQQRAMLPAGWHQSQDERGKPYYYDASGRTQWDVPTAPAAEPPPPPPKALTHQENLQRIIDECTKEQPVKPKSTPGATPQTPAEASAPADKKKPWESWNSVRKQQEYDHRVIQPLVQVIQDKYKGKLPAEEVKRLGKELRRVVTKSHFKKQLVKDPTKPLDGKLKHKTVEHMKEYFSKAHKKWFKHEQARKAARGNTKPGKSTTPPLPESPKLEDEENEDADPDMPAWQGDADEDDEHSLKSPSNHPENSSHTPPMDTPAPNENSFVGRPPPPPPPPHSENSSPFDGEEDQNGDLDMSVIPPPPPPPRDDDVEESPDKQEDDNGSVDVYADVSASELKRKWDDNSALAAEEDMKIKKLRAMDESALPKVNGIHRSEEVSVGIRRESEAMDGIIPGDGNSMPMKNEGPKSHSNGVDNGGQ